MSDKELKKIHGEDVELAPDDSEDEGLTEKKALAQAKADGVEFEDFYYIEGKPEVFETKKEAEDAAEKDEVVLQGRRQK